MAGHPPPGTRRVGADTNMALSAPQQTEIAETRLSVPPSALARAGVTWTRWAGGQGRRTLGDLRHSRERLGQRLFTETVIGELASQELLVRAEFQQAVP